MVATATKTTIWILRVLQWIFAIIILGTTAYFTHEFHKMGLHSPREVVVPLIFSVLAALFTAFSIAALFFMNHTLQLLSAALDFILWIGYLASAGLLRHNYHIRSSRNELRNKLEYGRMQVGLRPNRFRNNNLVRLLAALVLIQLFLFFFTMLLQAYAAKKYRDARRGGAAEVEKGGLRSRFGRGAGGGGGARTTTADEYGAPAPVAINEPMANPYATDPYTGNRI